MRTQPKGLRCFFVQRLFDRQWRFSFGYAGAVSDAKNMRVDSKGFRTKGGVHHDIGGFAAYAGQAFQNVSVGWNGSAMVAHQYFGQSDDIFGFAIEQSNGFDVGFQAIHTQIDHLRRGFDGFEQRLCRFVHANIG